MFVKVKLVRDEGVMLHQPYVSLESFWETGCTKSKYRSKGREKWKKLQADWYIKVGERDQWK